MATNFTAAPSSAAFSHAAPDHLKINLLRLALGVPKRSPSFSWTMRAGDTNEIQTGYRIVIVRRLSDMARQDFLLDTGWVASDENSAVSLTGLDTVLQDNELYYWAVQTRNKSGSESALSKPCAFSTAVGDEWEDTRGIWSEDANGEGNFSFLRTEFKIPDFSGVERALLSMTATSPEPSRQYVYHVFMNGQFVGLGPTRLGKNGPDGEEILYYNTFDVTSCLLAGANVLGAINYTTEEKSFLCQLTVFYKNGTKAVVFNSARDAEDVLGLDGRAAFGDTDSIGTAFYHAATENFNALLYPFGFDRHGYRSDIWQPVRLREDLEIENERLLLPYPSDPVGRFEQAVASVDRKRDGHYFIDMGQEIIGGLRLTLNAPMAHTIHLRFGEELNADGSVRFRMRTGNVYNESWTLRAGQQTLENYSMKAFRYVEIYDCMEEIGEQNVCGVVIRQPFDAEESYFTCSNDVLCYLYDTFKYAICTTNQDLYVNSQSRERRPQEGDALINMLSSYTYQSRNALARFSIDYLLTHPSDTAEYPLLTAHMVWLDYMYTGNRSLVRRAYNTLRTLLLSHAPDEETGLYACPTTKEDGRSAVMVDWPMSARDGYYMMESYYNTVYNAIYYLALTDLSAMAQVLRKEEDTAALKSEAERLRAAMLEQLYSASEGAFRDGLTQEGEMIDHFAQHATVMAMYAGVYDSDAMLDAMGRWLIAQDGIHTGVYGAGFLIAALYRAGFGNYATALLAADDLTPGAHNWTAALQGGGVTLAPEAWCAEELANMSLSHPWGTAPAALIVRGMFGIQPTQPGFRKFVIRPQVGDLPYASIRVPSVKGAITVTLAQNREAYEAEITVPANTTAEVFLPAVPGGTDTLFVNNQKAIYPVEEGYFHIPLGSGVHRLLAQ